MTASKLGLALTAALLIGPAASAAHRHETHTSTTVRTGKSTAVVYRSTTVNKTVVHPGHGHKPGTVGVTARRPTTVLAPTYARTTTRVTLAQYSTTYGVRLKSGFYA